MSSLLRALGIKDRATYLSWCKKNHPDKKRDDPDAERIFQEVQCDYRTYIENKDAASASSSASNSSKPQSAPKPSAQTIPTSVFFGREVCGTPVSNTIGKRCHLSKLDGYPTCFYHIPGSDHIKYLDPDDNPNSIFDFLGTAFKKERTFSTCTARKPNGAWCTSNAMIGSKRCKKHENYTWSPPYVLEIKAAKLDAPIFVGFLNKRERDNEHKSDFVHIRAKFGCIKSVSESKNKATHVCYKGKIIPINKFD